MTDAGKEEIKCVIFKYLKVQFCIMKYQQDKHIFELTRPVAALDLNIFYKSSDTEKVFLFYNLIPKILN